MGFVADIFSGSKAYQAQSGLQPGELEQASQERQKALADMASFVAATKPGSVEALAAQQALGTQLGQMAQGQGPSAAQAMLEQQRGQLSSSLASLLASQRGASQNVGLVGRTAARAGAEAGANLASQAATLRMQEQLQAISQAQNLAAQRVEQQRLGTAQYGQAALQGQQQLLAAQAQQEAQRTAMAQQQEATRGQIIGGLISGVGAATGALAGGGKEKGGGSMSPPVMVSEGGMIPENEPKDIISLLLESQPSGMAHGSKVPGKAKVDGDSEKNDTVPALLSPGEIVVPRSAAKDPDKAAAFAKSVAMRGSRKKKK